MRDIERIDEVVRMISPHLPEINANFERENNRFKDLLAQDHDLIGRVLKCHLIVEYYLERFLEEHLATPNLTDARLSFFQKAQLLPSQGQAVALVKPGIIRLNAIRNRFGHTLNPEIQADELEPLRQALAVVRAGVEFFEPVDVIEAFTTVACTWLIVVPPHLQKVWADAFASFRAGS